MVIGSGPNGLAAAIRMAERGARVLVLEGMPTAGGGMRTAELTLPGFHHDVCAAAHPMGVLSPYLRTLPLERHGLVWDAGEASVAHPFAVGPGRLGLARLVRLGVRHQRGRRVIAGRRGAGPALLRRVPPPQVHQALLERGVVGRLGARRQELLEPRDGGLKLPQALVARVEVVEQLRILRERVGALELAQRGLVVAGVEVARGRQEVRAGDLVARLRGLRCGLHWGAEQRGQQQQRRTHEPARGG